MRGGKPKKLMNSINGGIHVIMSGASCFSNRMFASLCEIFKPLHFFYWQPSRKCLHQVLFTIISGIKPRIYLFSGVFL